LKTRLTILAVVLLLITIGLVMIYSSSSIYAGEKYNETTYFFRKQLMWAFIGMIFLIIGAGINYDFFLKCSKFFLSAGVVLLIFTHFFGKKVGGAQRWLCVGGFTFQSSEVVKIAIIGYMADFLARKQETVRSLLKGFIPVCLVLGTVFVLIVTQPDLGTALLISMVCFILFFVGGIRKSYLLGSFLCSLPILYKFIFQVAYRRKRILSFLNPWEDPKGISFQIVQSFIALGSGGIFGVGLGQSKQKLFYLPEAHTDFIFSIMGEELGFIGCSLVIFLFAMLFVLGFKVSFTTHNLKAHLFSLGIIIMIALQAIINIGVVTGAFPTKGLPLPFVSFGGTSLVVGMFCIGILLNISKLEEALGEVSVSKGKKKSTARKKPEKNLVFHI